jgi:hypothetical protein
MHFRMGFCANRSRPLRILNEIVRRKLDKYWRRNSSQSIGDVSIDSSSVRGTILMFPILLIENICVNAVSCRLLTLSLK